MAAAAVGSGRVWREGEQQAEGAGRQRRLRLATAAASNIGRGSLLTGPTGQLTYALMCG